MDINNAKFRRQIRRVRNRRILTQAAGELSRRCQDLGITDASKSLIPFMKQVVIRRLRLPPNLLAHLFCCAARGISQSPVTALRLLRDGLRFACRIAQGHPDTSTLAAVLAALDGPLEEWHASLRDVNHRVRKKRQARFDAAVDGRLSARELERFATYLARRAGVRDTAISIRFDASGPGAGVLADATSASQCEIAAFNDGEVVHLPSHIAATSRTSLNQAFYYYLVLHECMHEFAGSFSFKLDTEAGNAILTMVEDYFGLTEEIDSTLSYDLILKLSDEGAPRAALRQIAKSDIAILFERIPLNVPTGWLFNAVEDGRIERLIEKAYPALATVHRAVDLIESREVRPSTYSLGREESLLYAVGFFAARRSVFARIAPADVNLFNQARSLVEESWQRGNTDVNTSVETTIRLIALLYSEQPDQLSFATTEESDWNPFFTPVSLEEFGARRQISNLADEEFSSNGEGDQWPSQSDENEPIRSGVWLPEHPRGKSHISIAEPAKPSESNPLPPLAIPFLAPRAAGGKPSARGQSRRFESAGDEIVVERLVDYEAAQANRDELPAIFATGGSQTEALHCTLCINLSISMEARRYSLDGQSPIDRAIQLGGWIAAELHTRSVTVEVFGAVDLGRSGVELEPVKAPSQLATRGIRCRGPGGFRTGAIIRALSQRPQGLGLPPVQGRHVVFLLTDGDPGYVHPIPSDEFRRVHKNNCPHCNHRAKCIVEVTPSAIGARPDPVSLFAPVEEELVDTAHAIEEATRRGCDVHFFVFNDCVPSRRFDESYGPSRWTPVTTPAAALPAIERLL